MANVASARFSLGSVFGTVATAANAVSSTFEAATVGVSMLDRFVQTAKMKQEERHIVDLADFRERLIEDRSREITERQVAVNEFVGKSALHKNLYEANYTKLEKLLAAHDAKKNSATTTASP